MPVDADVENVGQRIDRLTRQIQATEASLSELKHELAELRQTYNHAHGEPTAGSVESSHQPDHILNQCNLAARTSRWPLTSEEYRRYGRQLILPEVGLSGQLKLHQARALIVGVGGLGCPAAAYLSGAGVGTIGLVDGDLVEASNLHRQIAHNTARIGHNKAESAAEYIKSLNPLIQCHQYRDHLTPDKAVELFSQYDIVLDCTDHPTSRYLISDACVLTVKPLVSASALKTDGQLIVLNDPPRPAGDSLGGPCYRCVFPRPPPAESVVSCGEGGILGPVVGTMGILQALEAIKILTRKHRAEEKAHPGTTLMMFSAYSNPQFRSIRMRPRRTDCAVCSASAVISRDSLTDGSLDYAAFCGQPAPKHNLPDNARTNVRNYADRTPNSRDVLIDVRDNTQFEICHLPGSINIPWTGDDKAWIERATSNEDIKSVDDVYVICRFGNDSQVATHVLKQQELGKQVMDISGGFDAWRREIDQTWPDY